MPILIVLEHPINPVVLNIINNLSFLAIRIGILPFVNIFIEGSIEFTVAVWIKYEGNIDNGTGVTAQFRDLS